MLGKVEVRSIHRLCIAMLTKQIPVQLGNKLLHGQSCCANATAIQINMALSSILPQSMHNNVRGTFPATKKVAWPAQTIGHLTLWLTAIDFRMTHLSAISIGLRDSPTKREWSLRIKAPRIFKSWILWPKSYMQLPCLAHLHCACDSCDISRTPSQWSVHFSQAQQFVFARGAMNASLQRGVELRASLCINLYYSRKQPIELQWTKFAENT